MSGFFQRIGPPLAAALLGVYVSVYTFRDEFIREGERLRHSETPDKVQDHGRGGTNK